ncbi:MAG: hypothetical protein COW00_06010 [Bdellovibrio sp. CG12_big_fil_rev_8_21_14_0_65_39_13]|nr:MAG: hypothetical protein COW78_18545 [Bdellovibrio sp. CG22_combo_CG10-13_8_21_14_all_39_27]PIQ60783.1 MAG: hypothetical protein COW00_06010 [Bdellovibrio sp. CG12_big_fil_rev_8_21_14_0_65_39_13]PIR36406.1 MAG: hypothetical protein COV37_03350 [Bdellovibrio sp. CG11_big_fil_rev_8_21_14_0_20_39_38]
MDDSLLEQYKKQWKWRNWDSLYSKLPNINGSLVYDLGCAHGDHSEKLSSLGATVIGVDGNPDLLKYARERVIPNSNFYQHDLNNVEELNLHSANGIWTSFVPAYFPNFSTVLKKWKTLLRPGGWLAVTEMSDLLGHEPMSFEAKKWISRFYEDAFSCNAYDFKSGEKLKSNLELNGFEIKEFSFLEDRELSFEGMANRDILTAWKNRFERMGSFKSFLGDRHERIVREIMDCLGSENHTSSCRVYFYLAYLK